MRVAGPPPWRGRLELAVGKAQFDTFQWALRASAGLRPGECAVGAGRVRVPFLRRPGDGGRPIVMVHGFGGNKETWLMMAPFLARHRGLVLIDLPGHGAADDVAEGAASAGAQARVLLAVLDALELDRVDLVGNSMGGGVSLRVARDHAARVRSLTLIASVGPEVEKSDLRVALDRGENPLIPSGHDAASHDEFLKLVTEKPPRLPRQLQRFVTHQRVAAKPRLERIFRGWMDAAAGEAIPRELGGITTPTLVLHGARDRVIHPATARALAAGLPCSELVLLEGVGHIPQLEQPRQVARMVEGFLRRVPSR